MGLPGARWPGGVVSGIVPDPPESDLVWCNGEAGSGGE